MISAQDYSDVRLVLRLQARRRRIKRWLKRRESVPEVEPWTTRIYLGGLVLIVALGLWITHEAWGSGLPAGEDVTGHLVRTDYGIAHIVARGQLDGWFPRFMLGHQMFLFNGPGFTWILALMRGVSLGALSNEGAIKTAAIGGFVLFPVCVVFLARSFRVDRVPSIAAGLLTLGLSTPYGLGIEGVFHTGLVPHQVGACLFCLSLGGALRSMEESPGLWVPFTAATTALLMVAHLISALVLIIVVGVILAARLVSTRPSLQQLKKIALVGLWSVILAGFWIIPFLAHLDLRGPITAWPPITLASRTSQIWAGELLFTTPFVKLVLLGILVALSFALIGWRMGPELAIVGIAYYVITYGSLSLPRRDEIMIQLAHRGLGFAGMLTLIPIAAAMGYFIRRDKPLDLLLAVGGVAIVTVLSIGRLWAIPQSHSEPIPQMHDAAAMIRSTLGSEDRFVVERDFPEEIDRTGTIHPERWLAYATGRNTLNLFNPEAGPSGPAFASDDFGSVSPEESAVALSRLGVSYAVATSPELSALLGESPSYSLVWEREPMAIFKVHPQGDTTPPDVFLHAPSDVSVEYEAPDPEHLVYNVTTERQVVAEIPNSWSPKWRGSIDGSSLEVDQTDDRLIRVSIPAGNHELRLDFEPDVWDRVGAAVSLVGIVAFAPWFLRRNPRHGKAARNL